MRASGRGGREGTPRRPLLVGGAGDAIASLDHYLGGGVVARPVSNEVLRRIWPAEGFRLFLSHSATHAKWVGTVAATLQSLGVAGFVAHVSIELSQKWEDEILAALNSCEALAAMLHDDFHERVWTDQEVGHAQGRGVLVLPVMFDDTPYGFMNKYQAIKAKDVSEFQVAVAILDTLVGNEKTQPLIAPHLVTRFERAPTTERASSVLKRIERVAELPGDLLKRAADAWKSNEHVADPEVLARVHALLECHTYSPPPSIPSYDDFGEEPF